MSFINNNYGEFPFLLFSPHDQLDSSLAAASEPGLPENEDLLGWVTPPHRSPAEHFTMTFPFSSNIGLDSDEDEFPFLGGDFIPSHAYPLPGSLSPSLPLIQERSIAREHEYSLLADTDDEGILILSEDAASNSSPVSSSDSRKRGHVEISTSIAPSLLRDFEEVAYVIVLIQLFKNTLFKTRPANISEANWANLSELAQKKELIQIVSKAPFTYVVHTDLDFVLYILAKLGELHAMAQVDRLDQTFEERAQWWSASSLFGPVCSLRKSSTQPGNNITQRTLCLPPILQQRCEHLTNTGFRLLMTQILYRTLELALDRVVLNSVLALGTERLELPMIRPVNEAFMLATNETLNCYQTNPDPLHSIFEASTSLETSSAVPAAKRTTRISSDLVENAISFEPYLHLGSHFTKYVTLSYVIPGKLPKTQPQNITRQEWASLKSLEASSSIIQKIKLKMISGVCCINFKMPSAFNIFWRARALRSDELALKAKEKPCQNTVFSWWNGDRLSKKKFPLSTKIRAATNSRNGLDWVYLSTELPDELYHNLSFRALNPEAQLKVIEELCLDTLNICWDPNLLQCIKKNGFIKQRNSLPLRNPLEVGFTIALGKIIHRWESSSNNPVAST